MNREITLRRLSAVDNTVGSIVGIATWCTLHSHQAHLVFSCLEELMTSDKTTSSARVGLLFVVHELLLACAANGVPRSPKEAVLVEATKALPSLLRRAAQLDGSEEFRKAIGKVSRWWERLRLFAPPLITEMRALAAVEPSAVREVIPRELTVVANLLEKFNTSKLRLETLKGQHGADAVEVANAREEVVRRLIALQKAVVGREGNIAAAPSSLAGVLQKEMEELTGVEGLSAQHFPDPPDSVTGDILGSFF